MLGLFTGGILSVAGGNVSCTAGTGYISTGVVPNDILEYVVFDAQSTAVLANSLNYAYIASDASLQVSASSPSPTGAILLGSFVTNASNLLFTQQGIDYNLRHLASDLDSALMEALGPLVVSGMLVTNTGLELSISQGKYFVGAETFQPSSLPLGSSIVILVQNGGSIGGTWGSLTQSTVPLQWNDAGVLTSLTAGQYAKHSLFSSSEATNQALILIVGTEVFPSEFDANQGPFPAFPTFFTSNVVQVAAIVVDSTSIVSITDERPTLVTRTGAIVSTSNHSNLTNLGADDHLQYFRTDGTRTMTGDIVTGNNDIIVGSGLVDGVIVHAHASRHIPGGPDALPTAAASTISTANTEGIAGSFARSDHVHAHGAQTDASLHALANASAAGFLSSAGYTLLNGATASPTASQLALRDASGDTGVRRILLYDSSNAVSLAAASGTAVYTLTLPSSAGIANQVLTTNGSGVTTWTTPSTASGSIAFAQLGSNVTVNSASLIGISGLNSVTLPYAGRYYFRVRLFMQTSANNTNYLVSLNASGTVTGISYLYEYPTSANASTCQAVSSLQGGTASGTGSTTLRPCQLDGSITVSTPSTLQVQALGQTITLSTGSFINVQLTP